MRTIRVSIITMIIVLVGFSCITHQAIGQYVLPDFKKTVGYVRTLLDSYNALVNFNYANKPDFDSIKANFPLYLEAGNSFKVIVVQTQPVASSSISSIFPEWISLIFIPIRADQLNVTMGHNDNLQSLLPTQVIVFGEYAVQENIPFTYNDTVIHIDFILGIYASDISNDYIAHANDAAKFIYEQDQKQVPTVSQTQTVTQTAVISQQQPTSVQTGQNIFTEINSNPIIWVIGVFIAGLVMYFGGLREVIRLADPDERKKAIDEIKRLLRLLFGINKKPIISKVDREILAVLFQKGPLHTIRVAKEIDQSVTPTVLHLTQLEKDGFVVSTPGVAGRYWSVTIKGKDSVGRRNGKASSTTT